MTATTPGTVLAGPQVLTLPSGLTVKVLRIGVRQFFSVLRIVHKGAESALPNIDFSKFNFGGRSVTESDPESSDEDREAAFLAAEKGEKEAEAETVQTIITIVLAVVSTAVDVEDEFNSLMSSLVAPVLPFARPLDDGQNRENEAYKALFAEAMENLDLIDLLTVLETVVSRESADLAELGKRLGRMLPVAVQTGQMSPAAAATVRQAIEEIL